MSRADDVVPDRLAEELRREARRIGSSRLSDLALISADEVERLIAEVERLRGALQALVDATAPAHEIGLRHGAWIDGVDEARAVAVAVLAGQEPT